MSATSVKELLQMLQSLSSEHDGKGVVQKNPQQIPQKLSGSGPISMSMELAAECKQSAGSRPKNALSSQHDGHVSSAAANILSRWRANGGSDAREPSAPNPPAQELNSTSAPQFCYERPPQTPARRPDDSSSEFDAAARPAQPSLSNFERLLAGAATKTAQSEKTDDSRCTRSCQSIGVFEAASILFLDFGETPAPRQTQKMRTRAAATIVQRVTRGMADAQVCEVLPSDCAPYAATLLLSKDGQEVLWRRRNGLWCSFFVRDVVDVTLGSASMPGTGAAGDCVFCVHLHGRRFTFAASTPQLMRRWVVGLLVLLESAAGTAFAFNIWRSLGDQLLQTTAAADATVTGRDVPASVEDLMQAVLKARVLQPVCEVIRDPLMCGTFPRRVVCTESVVLVQTAVVLGELPCACSCCLLGGVGGCS
jgi:hypothetical protein